MFYNTKSKEHTGPLTSSLSTTYAQYSEPPSQEHEFFTDIGNHLKNRPTWEQVHYLATKHPDSSFIGSMGIGLPSGNNSDELMVFYGRFPKEDKESLRAKSPTCMESSGRFLRAQVAY
ncbi:hypothetical protein E5288_WYG005960 [Bos mutus]|uniref:Uncharacterized protein n=1 Tax=Bos mutus TaxID=72004 RepID=A0A6B0QX94_9CETA|nr:hypothetical protein [Bos mutus]